MFYSKDRFKSRNSFSIKQSGNGALVYMNENLNLEALFLQGKFPAGSEMHA
jgi:hypothetical protein